MTGESGYVDLLPGGEHYEWAEHIRKAAQKLARQSRWAVKFMRMRPFDKYQGPYAQMTGGCKLWSNALGDTFFFECSHPDISSTADEPISTIAARLRAYRKGAEG